MPTDKLSKKRTVVVQGGYSYKLAAWSSGVAMVVAGIVAWVISTALVQRPAVQTITNDPAMQIALLRQEVVDERQSEDRLQSWAGVGFSVVVAITTIALFGGAIKYDIDKDKLDQHLNVLVDKLEEAEERLNAAETKMNVGLNSQGDHLDQLVQHFDSVKRTLDGHDDFIAELKLNQLTELEVQAFERDQQSEVVRYHVAKLNIAARAQLNTLIPDFLNQVTGDIANMDTSVAEGYWLSFDQMVRQLGQSSAPHVAEAYGRLITALRAAGVSAI